jgi:hypothetical protein
MIHPAPNSLVGSSGGAPSSDQTGQDTLSSDQIGGFVHRIAVNLAGHISGAQIQATYPCAEGRLA